MSDTSHQQTPGNPPPARVEAAPSAPDSFAPRPPNELGRRRGFVLAVSCLGGFLVSFMTSAVNIALPLIGEEFDASAVMLGWISLVYILVAAAVLLPVGRMVDSQGRVRFFVYSMALFTVIAFASAFAASAPVLLALRAIQGIGLALGTVTSISLVVLAFPDETRGRALGLATAGVYSGLTLGPVLGGLIIHNLGWRMLFAIVGALGLVNIVLPLWKLRGLDRREPRRAGFDYLGSAIFAVALPMLLLGFTYLPDPAGYLLLAGGLGGLVAFFCWEARAADPLLRVDMLRSNRVFTYGNAATFINYAATSAMIFLLSLYLQYNRGLTAQTAGLVLMVGAVFQTVFAPAAGRLADHVQARYVATSGMILSLLGLAAFSFLGATTPYWYIILALSTMGLGLAFFSSPNTYVITNSVDKSEVGIATAIIGVMRNTGMSMSTGLATLVIAVVVGREAIKPEDYPQLLRSIQITFMIFTVLCVFGVAASLVGRRNGAETHPRQEEQGGGAVR